METSRGIYFGALAVGTAFVVWLLSLHAILPPDPLHLALVGDSAVSAIGQRYFLAAPWRWPPLYVAGLDVPRGVNVAMMDSIPLAMLALKPFRSFLPPGFFTETSWVALVWALQPVAAVYALRGAGERRLMPAAVVAVLSLSMPTLLIRYGHMALCTHAAILAALGLYLRLTAPRARIGVWLLAGVLAAGCVLVHPYILALVLGVLAAAPLTLLLRRDPRWPLAAGSYGAVIAVVGLLAVLLDYGGTAPAPGFGYYSMNLLGPFLPSRSGLFPELARDPTGGQALEGYQYLGAGLLLLLAVGVVQGIRGQSGVAWRRHAGLLLVLAGMAVFALSNEVYAGRHHLLHIGFVPAAIQQFRATGRFFWPAAYTILITGVLIAVRSLPKAASAALLALVVCLQAADTAPLRAGLWTAGHFGNAWEIDTAKLGPIFAAHDRLTMWPTFGCGGTVIDDATTQALLLASQTLMPTNTMFTARTREPAVCDPAAVLGVPLLPGELRVITRAADHWLVPDSTKVCRTAGTLVLCARDASSWADLPPVKDVILPAATVLTPADPRLAAAIAEDWSPPDPGGVWSDGAAPTLRFTLPPSTGADTVVTLQALGFAAAPGDTQAVDVFANGEPVARWRLPDMAAATVQATLPTSLSGPVALQMRVEAPARPVDRGMNSDTRRLGIRLLGIRLDSRVP